jgi:hypothetical protein
LGYELPEIVFVLLGATMEVYIGHYYVVPAGGGDMPEEVVIYLLSWTNVYCCDGNCFAL